jgi:predicted ATPase
VIKTHDISLPAAYARPDRPGAARQEPDLVAASAITAPGIQLSPGRPPLETLAAALARRQPLLVMDNCEHVLGAVGDLCGALLPAADDVRILATSRQPVGLAGEARYRLPRPVRDKDCLKCR